MPDGQIRDLGRATDAAGRPAPGSLNAMSVDVEDYYQVSAFDGVVRRRDWNRYEDRVGASTRRVLALFEAAGVRGTFFILGCVARRHPDLVRAIADAGHEIASHGFAHHRVCELTPSLFLRDVRHTKRRLEDIAGRPVRGYRAPSFSISHATWWAYDALAEAGYRYSSSVYPIRHDHYGLPDAPRDPFQPLPGFTEIPITTVMLGERRLPCGGGGYFRLLPYALSKRAIARVNAEPRPAMFYFHPWEIDPGQPRIHGASLRSQFRHTVQLDRMEGKLSRLVRDFRWGRIDSVYPIPA